MKLYVRGESAVAAYQIEPGTTIDNTTFPSVEDLDAYVREELIAAQTAENADDNHRIALGRMD